VSSLMGESPRERQSGDVGIHVKDSYLWGAIQYLDSPTDYRECIRPSYMPALSSDDFTTEDERTSCRVETFCALTFIGFLASIFLMLTR